MSINKLQETLTKVPIVKKGSYQYVIHPITDGIPSITPELLQELTDEIYQRMKKYGKIDKIVTMEAMGIPLAAALSLKTRLPFTIIRKKSYGLPDEISVEQVTGYSKAHLYINGLKSGDRIVIVDDVVSTGGTLRAVLTVLKKMGVKVKGTIIAIDKGNTAKAIAQESGIAIETLVKIDIVDGKVVFKP